MLPPNVLELLQTPIAFYAIILTVLWLIIQATSKYGYIEVSISWARALDSKHVYGILICYIVLTLIVIQLNVNFFPYLHAFTLALIFWLLTETSSLSRASSLLLTVIVAIMPILVMISTKHPLPLGDDARFPGFAAAIENDGRWIPYKYAENPYYQFFHLIPALEYVLASIMGVGTSNVMSYYLTLKITLYLVYFLSVLLVVRKLSEDGTAPLIAILLLSITPPLALTQVVHQSYAIVLFLLSASMIMSSYKGQRTSKASMLISYLLWLAGVIAHATFAIMFLAFILPLVLTNEPGRVRGLVLKAIGSMSVISMTFWMYTYVLDVIVRPTISAFDRLIDFFTGRIDLWYATAQPWYAQEASMFFIAWALVPSIAASSILLYVLQLFFRKNDHDVNFIFMLAFIGLAGTVINFILRSMPTFGGRYFYWLYLLMLPASAQATRNTSRKFIGLVFTIALISLISFYGVQDPTLSANTYAENIGWADKVSWCISLSLSRYLDHSGTLIWMDPRLSSPLSSLKPGLLNSGTTPSHQIVAIIGADDVGFRATFRDPRDAAWFIKNFDKNPINFSLSEYSIILHFERYIGIWRGT